MTPALSSGEILRRAVAHYGEVNPAHTPLKSVASITGIGLKALSMYLHDDRRPRLDQFCAVLRACSYPEGFEGLKRIYFPEMIPREEP